MALISRRMTCSSFYVTAFPNGLLLGTTSYFAGGGVTDSWENIYLYHGEPVGSFVGRVADRERKHPSERHPGTRAHRERRCPG